MGIPSVAALSEWETIKRRRRRVSEKLREEREEKEGSGTNIIACM